MELRTSISKVTEKDTIIRGESLSRLAEERPFHDAIFLLLKGTLPTPAESQLFSAMLTISIDHGMGTASAMTTRFVQSTGNQLNTAVGAGILALGKHHGGAVEECMLLLKDRKEPAKVVRESLQMKKRLPGYGHKLFKDEDPRTVQLASLARKLKVRTSALDYALLLKKELEAQKGRKLCLNVDGCMAALLLDIGFPSEAGNGTFIVARTPGLVAQAIEERAEPPVRRMDEKDIEYVEE